MLARAAAWVATFEKNFSTVVAEERYVQLIKPWFGVPNSPDDEPELAWSDDPKHMLPNRPNAPIERRQLRSDVLLVQAPGERWTCYRDVFEVAAEVVSRALVRDPLELRAVVGRLRQEEPFDAILAVAHRPSGRAGRLRRVTDGCTPGSRRIWVMTDRDPAAGLVRYVTIQPGHSTAEIQVRVRPLTQDTCRVTVTYRRTGLSAEGDRFVDTFAAGFEKEGPVWEELVNRRLRAWQDSRARAPGLHLDIDIKMV